jgi:predicted dehydrogenase
MKVLIAGLGSIGQRHLRNLRMLLGDGADILAHRVVRRDHVIADDMTIVPGETVEQRYGVRVFDELDAALAERPAAVFVCNPTSLHAETAIAALEAGCHVFIEKPLSHSVDEVDRMIGIAGRQGRVAAVGYQLRCHPVLLRVRQLLAAGAIGPVRSARAEFGEYLPDAHPYENYRISYAARAALGGGVIMCYIHEFDYLCWLFGMPKRVSTTGGRLGDLDIDVEDTATTRLDYCVDGRPVAIDVYQSFLQRPPSRTCEIVGELGTIRIDLRASSIRVEGASDEFSTYPIARNELFLQELRHFLAAMSGAPAQIVTLAEAAQSLKVALAAKASLADGQAVALA